jgi:hypothetical protein
MTDSTTTAASYVGVGQWCVSQTTCCDRIPWCRERIRQKYLPISLQCLWKACGRQKYCCLGAETSDGLRNRRDTAPRFVSFNFKLHSSSHSVKLWFQIFLKKMLFLNLTAFYENSCSQIINYWLSGYWRRIANFFTSPICIRFLNVSLPHPSLPSALKNVQSSKL